MDEQYSLCTSTIHILVWEVSTLTFDEELAGVAHAQRCGAVYSPWERRGIAAVLQCNSEAGFVQPMRD